MGPTVLRWTTPEPQLIGGEHFPTQVFFYLNLCTIDWPYVDLFMEARFVSHALALYKGQIQLPFVVSVTDQVQTSQLGFHVSLKERNKMY